jgi:hypothetical protein
VCIVERKRKANRDAQCRGTTLQCGVPYVIEEAHFEQRRRNNNNAKRDDLTTSMGRYFELMGIGALEMTLKAKG